MSAIVIEDAQAEHIVAIRDIYAQHVLHSIATFETEPPDEAEMRQRWQKIRDAGLPWLVATQNQQVLGYCYLGMYRTRFAYRFTLEDSIYLHQDHLGKGVGKRLLSAALSRAEQQGYRQVISVVGNSENQASLQLHLSLGFERIGTLRSVGMKHGRWVDTVLLQRALGEGDASLPHV
ncbi:GNAT family N-acetyltransferase [Dickeya sp. NCPPB 3274]|uniref:GNAT family N-acetyltransferase n=1 Tax=Dickeya sp. NCPPB 3274 TaxID=568766 RepID=UPI0003A91D51|nr:GNAT family N-acetyltransferase [Dickeya sp. NCPPB 3274]